MKIKTGTYTRQGHMWRYTYNILVQRDNRICIEIVSGPPKPYEGYIRTTVSSVSSVDGGLLVDATHKQLLLQGDFMYFLEKGEVVPDDLSTTRGRWERTRDAQISDNLEECFAASGIYVKTERSTYIPGRVIQNQQGTLTAENPQAQINIRIGPGVDFDSPSYGIVGDAVTIESSEQDSAGAVWYKVKFLESDSSNTQGWIRSDLVQRPDQNYPGQFFNPK